MGQEGKPFSSAFSKLAGAKTDADKANEQVKAATDKAMAFAQSLKAGAGQAAPQPKPAGAAPQPKPAGAAPQPKPTAVASTGAVPTKPAGTAPGNPAGALKPLDEIAKLVIRGNYGNGEERKRRLTAEGYDYAQVQKRVNELLK